MYITVLLLAALVSTAYTTCTQTITNGSTAKTMSCSECNGLDDLCDLRIDQVTFPGTHNSGSGFDGLLYYYIGTAVGSCFYRNQGKSFTDQLSYGIRSFDIDTCYKDNKVVNCHCGAGSCAYTSSMEKALQQIDAWMKTHTSEVIVIMFGRDAQEGYRKEIAQGLKSLLIKLWDPNSSNNPTMSTYYNTNNKWPTLREAIQSRQRILIFMDNNLSQHITNQNWPWLVTSNNIIGSTWTTVTVIPTSCSGIISGAKSKCGTPSELIALSASGTSGLCTWDMATVCSKWLGEAQDACYNIRKNKGRTVNFLHVDYAVDYYYKSESVVNKAKFMNQKNIKQYLNIDIFFPEFSGCSYHAGWFGKYCWKYCSGYGWCWINQSCEDNDVCKEKDYSCYSSCGY